MQIFRQFDAGHLRHGEVGDHQVEGVRILAERGKRLDGRVHGDDIEAEMAHHDAHHLSGGQLVIDEQHPCFVLLFQWREIGLLRFGFFIDQGQKDLERAAFAGRAFDRYVAAEAGDDTVHHRKPESGALVERLGREERLEHSFQRGCIHAVAVVGDAELRVAPGLQGWMFFMKLAVRLHFAKPDGDLAARFLHCLEGVGAEIDDDLMELRGIGQHVAAFPEAGLDGDGYGNRWPQQFHGLFDDGLHVDHDRFGLFRAAEGQNLRNQVLRSLAGQHDLLEEIMRRALFGHHNDAHLRIAKNR